MSTEPPPYSPFPAEALRAYARYLLATGDPPTNVYDQYRALCDAVILTAAPAVSQIRFARVLGMSRTTLRTMIRRLGLPATDGRRTVPS